MRRPLPVAVVVVAFLLLLGSPFLGVRFGLPDDRAGAGAGPAAAGRFAAADGTWPSVVPSVDPSARAAEDLVAEVRALPDPLGVQVTGPAAQLVDTRASLAAHLPAAAAVIAVVTFLLLFLFTGSVVIPLKALVLNLLSLTAVYGAMVFVLQEGNLAGVLGFTATGTIDTSMPVLMFCIAFGLSMDYEVVLLSRIKEAHDRTGDTVAAAAVGLERSGRIVTAAAGLLAIVFAAFATSRVSFLQLFGVGAALAVIVDATLTRALLVPAFMRLAGQANWWAPGPLRRRHRRVGLREVPEPSGV
jgi:RND superfamily putative drug exporter